jgi:hypothetical protein
MKRSCLLFLLAVCITCIGIATAQPGKPAKPDKPEKKQPDVEFVPTPQDVVEKMLELAKVTKDDVVYDLGSGDGRIVITAGRRYGCKAVGYEIDPKLVRESRIAVRAQRLEKLVSIERQDIFTVDLSAASVLGLYLKPDLYEKLLPQFDKMKPGSRIVSHQYLIPGVKPARTVRLICNDGFERVIHLWITPLKRDKLAR